MTEVEILRTAARLMRERAAFAAPGPWFVTSKADRYGGLVAPPSAAFPMDRGYGGHLIGESMSAANREHVRYWHPAVALAVADWLDAEAGVVGVVESTLSHAVAVARAYLDGQPSQDEQPDQIHALPTTDLEDR